jgi:hypothetical protein
VAAYPELATIIEIGQSTEGRPMRVLKISNGPGKKALFADAAIHAREWITPPVILKIAFELLENYQTNKALVDMVDWYILPVANPGWLRAFLGFGTFPSRPQWIKLFMKTNDP